jgi:integrative and conjugative element protein (TIGR02256 family)
VTEAQRRVMVRAPAARAIREALARVGDLETGGLLVGPPLASDPIIVTHAIGPGPLARHGPTTFSRDTQWCEIELRRIQEALPVDWIGDWHSHPQGLVRPSGCDLETARSFVLDLELGFESFLICIAVPGRLGGQVGAWMVDREGVAAGLPTDWDSSSGAPVRVDLRVHYARPIDRRSSSADGREGMSC